MGTVRPFEQVKPFAGVLVSDERLLEQVRERLVKLLGPIDHESEVLPFDFTDYYSEEMGEVIDRIFFSFKTLLDADSLAEVKLETNRIETEFQDASGEFRRPVNVDPGYIEQSKVVLASTKNFYHRAYLGSGIFAEVTMHFKNNTYQFFPWTYPDYKSKDYQEFFLRMRQIYRAQLKNLSDKKSNNAETQRRRRR